MLAVCAVGVWFYWELMQMPLLELLPAVGRWCSVAWGASLLPEGHASLALTFCLLCKHLD